MFPQKRKLALSGECGDAEFESQGGLLAASSQEPNQRQTLESHHLYRQLVKPQRPAGAAPRTDLEVVRQVLEVSFEARCRQLARGT